MRTMIRYPEPTGCTMRFLTPFLLIALLVAQPLQAQDALSTDRPDFTDSPITVGQGTLQVEAGLSHQATGNASILTTGEGIIRYGLRPGFELRVGIPSLISGDGVDGGLSDMSVGIKWTIAQLENGTDMGLVASTTLPTGSDDFTADDPNPTVTLALGKPLTQRVSLASQLSSTLFMAGDDWKALWNAAAVLSAPINAQVGAFAGLKVEQIPDVDARLFIQAGVTYPVSDDFQLDLHAGTGLNDVSGDEFIGLGLAFRR